MQAGGLSIDTDTRRLTPAGEIPSRPRAQASSTPLIPAWISSREKDSTHWHCHYISSSRTLDVHMRRLLEQAAEIQADFTIQVVRGVGVPGGRCCRGPRRESTRAIAK